MSQSSSMVWRWPRNLPSLLASALASRAARRWSAERDRTVIDDATGPRAHHADVVGEISGLAQVVGDEQYGRPAYEPQLLEDRPQLLARELVECAKRFVEQQKLRIVDQRAAERRALEHAAGKLPGMLVAETFEPDLRKQRFDAVAKLPAAFGAVRAAERRHDLERQHDVVALKTVVTPPQAAAALPVCQSSLWV